MTPIRNKGRRLNRYYPDYVIFDLETTGLSPETDSIIEVSAIKVIKGTIADEYSTLVNPGRKIPRSATAINGITDSMVADAPTLQEAMGEFLAFVENAILVGHNIHTFDTNFVYDAALSLFQKEMKNDYVDTLYLARKCLPKLDHYRLSDISTYFKISTSGAHRAMNDCIMNQKCYEQMGKLLAKEPTSAEPVIVCPLCGGELIQRKGRHGAFYGCGSYPTCRFTRNI